MSDSERLCCGHPCNHHCLLTQLGRLTATENCEELCRICRKSPIDLEEELAVFGSRLRLARDTSSEFARVDFFGTLSCNIENSRTRIVREGRSRDAPEPLPASIGPYKVLGLLGRGGMGIVYRVLAPDRSHELALKTLSGRYKNDSRSIARFRREAATIGKLNHPGIVPLIDWGQSDDLLFMVMPLIEGATLASIRNPAQVWRLPDASEVIRQTAEAIAYAHSSMVIHRDIKPTNLMLTRTADDAVGVRVLDLGIARFFGAAAESTLTEHGQTLGTLDFIAPEQIGDSHNVDVTADVYSLGATAYFLMTGAPPCGTSQSSDAYDRLAAVRNMIPVRTSVRNPELPRALAAFIDRMLEKEPTYRPRSMIEIASVFAEFSSHHQLVQRLDESMRCGS